MEKSKKKKINLVVVFGIALSLIAIIGFGVFALEVVGSGHGLGFYSGGRGLQMNYLGILILLGLIPVIIFVAWIVRIWQKRNRLY
jgi:hypothetical protein